MFKMKENVYLHLQVLCMLLFCFISVKVASLSFCYSYTDGFNVTGSITALIHATVMFQHIYGYK